MSELDTCWVCTPGGKAHVALPVAEAFDEVISATDNGRQWVTFGMPNGGEAVFRPTSITCINSHVEPRREVRDYFNNH